MNNFSVTLLILQKEDTRDLSLFALYGICLLSVTMDYDVCLYIYMLFVTILLVYENKDHSYILFIL
jgi:hypothetical protein